MQLLNVVLLVSISALGFCPGSKSSAPLAHTCDGGCLNESRCVKDTSFGVRDHCECSHTPRADLGTRKNSGRSCNDIYMHRNSIPSGKYWINPGCEGRYPYEVYCDMNTAGGGWTLVVKVKGNDAFMNRANSKQWRDGRLIGDPTSLSDENAMGIAYTNLPFREVMIRSLVNSAKHLAWRHPQSYDNIQSIVKSCTRIGNGVKISGDIAKLDFRGTASYLKPCTELVYGFMGGDWHFALTTVAGCSVGHKHGHTGGVIGAFLDPPSGDRSRVGQTVKCITDFGVGGGYRQLSTADDSYAINAHWWGASNDYTHSWGPHAVFVR